MRCRRLLPWNIFFLLCGICASAPGQLQFDAATVKPASPGPGSNLLRGGPGTADPGRVIWEKTRLLDFMAKAFHVDPYNIAGPEWISRPVGGSFVLYTFTATMPADTSKHDFDIMFQNFLTEQFKIALHHEPRSFPAYDLVVAPGGSKLKASADQSDPTGPDGVMFVPKLGSDGFALLEPGHKAMRVAINGSHNTYQQFSMSEFVEELMWLVTPQGERHHYVIDKTGLAGRYDIKIKFDNRDSVIRVGPNVEAALPAPDPLGPGSGLPTIFKALEQQLGLKLVKAEDTLRDTIVIDHAERLPVGN